MTRAGARARAAPTPRRPPNRRGEGPSYRAAALCAAGVSLEEAARREGVTEASVARTIRYGDRRPG